METGCNYIAEDGKMYVSTDELKWKNKLLRLKKEHPNEVTVLKYPEENDGTLYCIVPPSWLKIAPPVKRILSEEQRQAYADRFKELRSKEKQDGDYS